MLNHILLYHDHFYILYNSPPHLMNNYIHIFVWIIFYVTFTNSILLQFIPHPVMQISSQYIQAFEHTNSSRALWPARVWSGCRVGSLTAESPFTTILGMPLASLLLNTLFPEFIVSFLVYLLFWWNTSSSRFLISGAENVNYLLHFIAENIFTLTLKLAIWLEIELYIFQNQEDTGLLSYIFPCSLKGTLHYFSNEFFTLYLLDFFLLSHLLSFSFSVLPPSFSLFLSLLLAFLLSACHIFSLSLVLWFLIMMWLSVNLNLSLLLAIWSSFS